MNDPHFLHASLKSGNLGNSDVSRTISSFSRPAKDPSIAAALMPSQLLPLTCWSSLPSYRSVVLARHQADRDRVRQPPLAALLPDPVQRRQRRGLPGPRRPLSHH